MRRYLLAIIIIFPIWGHGQPSWKSNPISVSVLNNATLLPPASFTAVFDQPFHPGITISYEFGWKETPNHKWFHNVGVSYIYHRLVHQAVLLNTQAGYRWKIKKFSLEGYLQAGYLHAFPFTDRAVFQSDGTYLAKRGIGKPQFITGAGFGLGYNLGEETQLRRVFLNYDVRLQMPFVKGYVPVLPSGGLSLGVQFNLK